MAILPRSKGFLGVALDDRSARVVEVRATSAGREALRAADFPFPDGFSFVGPNTTRGAREMGRVFANFLRGNRFSARRAVFGVPAHWLAVNEKRVPPATRESAADILRLHAEQDLSMGQAGLRLDYTGEPDPRAGRSVLLVAAPAERVDRVLAFARGAGLAPRAVTSTVLALAAAGGPSNSGLHVTLWLEPGRGEMTVHADGRFRGLRNVPIQRDGTGAGVLGEVRRAVSLLPGGGEATGPRRLTVWNAAGADLAGAADLDQRLALDVETCDGLSALGVAHTALGSAADAGRFAGAAALGLAGLDPSRLAIDLVHSRLAPAKKTKASTRVAWSTAAALAVMVAAVFLWLDTRAAANDVKQLSARLAAMAPDIASARALVERVSFARGWSDRRPSFLECLRELTLAFPAEGRVWATSLVVREDMHGVLSAKSVDESSALDVLDRLAKSRRFKDVELLHLRQATGRSRAVSFAISLTFTNRE